MFHFMRLITRIFQQLLLSLLLLAAACSSSGPTEVESPRPAKAKGKAAKAAKAPVPAVSEEAEAGEESDESGDEEAAQAPKPIFLWQVVDPKHPNYPPLHVYGTIHLSTEDLAYLDKSVVKALRSSQNIYLELDPKESNSLTFKRKMDKRGYLPEGQFLKDFVTPKTLSDLKMLMNRLALSKEVQTNILKMRTWYATMNLTLMKYISEGNTTSFGSEEQLTALALERSKPVFGLESGDEQLDAFSAGSLAAQEFGLRLIMREIMNPSREMSLDSEVDVTMNLKWLQMVYADGNVELLSQYAKALSSDIKSREFYKNVAVERNKKMAQRIQTLMANKQKNFVAVGVLHLAGPDNLLTLLQAQGMQVKRVPQTGKVDTIFRARPNPAIAKLDKEGYTQVNDDAFSARFFGPVIVEKNHVDPPSPNHYGYDTISYVGNIGNSNMYVQVFVYPPEFAKQIAQYKKDDLVTMLKPQLGEAVKRIGKADGALEVLDGPVSPTLAMNAKGDLLKGKIKVFYSQSRVFIVMAVNSVNAVDPEAVAQQQKTFFDSFRLKAPARNLSH